MQRKKINLVTLGCPKNIVDSEKLIKQFESNGLEVVDNSDYYDYFIINTCGFIKSAKEESIDAIINATRLKEEGRINKLIVMGCLSERYANELEKEIPEVDIFIGANKLQDVMRALDLDWRNDLTVERSLLTPSHYAYLKISEGCDRPCSFCAIPAIRGNHRSLPLDILVQEAKILAGRGVKELIVIAQDTTYYGLDIYGKRTLGKLLNELSDIDGLEWIRLMYAYPSGFPPDVIDLFAKNPKICKYLDIPLQHISDSVLLSMKRGISSKEIRNLIYTLREKISGIELRTTFIVGYPNESEKDFYDLMKFVDEVKFERMGVFIYSPEEGTDAYNLGDPIPLLIKEERYAAIMELQHKISYEYNNKLVGKNVKVIIDNVENESGVGRTEFDAPEVDNEVLVSSKRKIIRGYFYNVEIQCADAYDLRGIVK
mgnify:FL=1